MQMVDTNELPLRARYYQGICDTETLGVSRKYKDLKEQYIIFLCPKDVFGQARPIYEFENREKDDHSLKLNDLTYKYFLNFEKYSAVTDESIRDYMTYFATDEATSAATLAIQNKVEFYHADPKTRSDYMTFKDMLEDEREAGREEALAEVAAELAAKDAKLAAKDEKLASQTAELADKDAEITRLKAELAKAQQR